MDSFWKKTPNFYFERLNLNPEGISDSCRKKLLTKHGYNEQKTSTRGAGLKLFFAQLKAPLLWILIFAAALSLFLENPIDAVLILTIVFFSALLGFFQERGALKNMEKIFKTLESKTLVKTPKGEKRISSREIIPGDILTLQAGDFIPADCLLLETHHLFIDEASISGESLPIEKQVFLEPTQALESKKENALFAGTQVISGFCQALAIYTGKNTFHGELQKHIRFSPPETSFEQGIRKFSYFLMEVTLMLVLSIFFLNTFFGLPIIESLLFSVALSVGLTPQLLPAIISVNLSKGAKVMAEQGVLVKRLPSIENFGQMTILCTDKTGTLTEGKLHLEKATNAFGAIDAKTLDYGLMNAHFQKGYENPIDLALKKHPTNLDFSKFQKIDEIPFDFQRKRVSVFLKNKESFLISKGSFNEILKICSFVEIENQILPIETYRAQITENFLKYVQAGFRVIALAYGKENKEENLTFLGFLHFADPIKKTAKQTVDNLRRKGIQVKILTGDHKAAAQLLANSLEIDSNKIICGEELKEIPSDALIAVAQEKNIFAEVDPIEKERIIQALKKADHTVGFLGDGINDIAALHASDVGISVDTGAASAKEVSDIVLLHKDLCILQNGVTLGRKTFMNTLKYIFMATSANFGNMFSMAGASLFLPFLPLLPSQVLLTNLCTDIPEMTIAQDNVDPETVEYPPKWDISFIRHFMLIYGLLSSLFDFITFGCLFFILKADPILFRTGWFIESVLSASFVVLVIRTRHPFFKSKPSKWLTCATIFTSLSVITIPYTQLGHLFGFEPLPTIYYPLLLGILASYLTLAELCKKLIKKQFHGHF